MHQRPICDHFIGSYSTLWSSANDIRREVRHAGSASRVPAGRKPLTLISFCQWLKTIRAFRPICIHILLNLVQQIFSFLFILFQTFQKSLSYWSLQMSILLSPCLRWFFCFTRQSSLSSQPMVDTKSFGRPQHRPMYLKNWVNSDKLQIRIGFCFEFHYTTNISVLSKPSSPSEGLIFRIPSNSENFYSYGASVLEIWPAVWTWDLLCKRFLLLQVTKASSSNPTLGSGWILRVDWIRWIIWNN